MRLGGNGGYGSWTMNPDGFGPESVVYSAGIGTDVSFDLALIERFGVRVHAFDPTPASQAWLGTQRLPDELVVHPVGLAAYDGSAPFFANANPDWISHSIVASSRTGSQVAEIPVRRLSSLMSSLGHDHIDLLKMDIEGAEYAVLDDLLTTGLPVHQVLVEFHGDDHASAAERAAPLVDRLSSAGLDLIHVSSRGEEYSFLRVER